MTLNKVQLIGNLGQDPETKSMNNGREYCHLSLATSERWKDKASGEQREQTEWHRVVIFNEGLVRIAKQYLRQGSKVYLEGKIQTRKWQAQDGGDRYATEIVLTGFDATLKLLDRRPDSGGGSRNDAAAQGDRASQHPSDRAPMDLDDDIPF